MPYNIRVEFLKGKNMKTRLLLALIPALTVLAGCNNDKHKQPKITLEDLRANPTSVQQNFTYGDDFNYDGLVVEALYSDGSSRTLTDSEYNIDKPNMFELGQHQIYITYYEGKFEAYDFYTIFVNDAEESCSETIRGNVVEGVEGSSFEVTFDNSSKLLGHAAKYTDLSGKEYLALNPDVTGCGIVTTTSREYVFNIWVNWDTTYSRAGAKLCIYGKNTPYTSTQNLYNEKYDGTAITHIEFDKNNPEQFLKIEANYKYFGIRPVGTGKMCYLNSIRISWRNNGISGAE